MKPFNILQVLLFLILVPSATVLGYGGDGGDIGDNPPTRTTTSVSVTFEDPSSDNLSGIEDALADTPETSPADENDPPSADEIKALEDALAEAIRNGQIAEDDLEWAEFWSRLSIDVEGTLAILSVDASLTVGFPVSWVYNGVRRGTSWAWGWATGNKQAVDEANEKTLGNQIANRILNHPEFKKAMEMYHRVQEAKAARGEI